MKNVLAVVQSLAMQTNGHITSVAVFKEAFLGRLHALAPSMAFCSMRNGTARISRHWSSRR